MKRRDAIVLVLLVAAFSVVAVVFFALRSRTSGGIDVTIVNRGPGTITDAEIQGLHHGYALGKLTPGGSGIGRITTGSESDIAVEFRDAEGVWHRVESGVTFKHGDGGKVTIEIERYKLAKVENQVEPWKK